MTKNDDVVIAAVKEAYLTSLEEMDPLMSTEQMLDAWEMRESDLRLQLKNQGLTRTA